MVFVYGIGDIISVAFFLITVLIITVLEMKKYLKQRRCKHENFRETMACDAICNDCGKNLGFIGTILDLRNARQVLEKTDE